MAEWNFRGRMASKVLDACTYTCKACPTVEELDEQRIGVEWKTRKANECRLRLMTVAKIGSTYRENLSGEQHMVLKMLKMERLRGVNDQLVFAKHEQKKKKLDVAALGDRVEELNEAFNMAKGSYGIESIGRMYVYVQGMPYCWCGSSHAFSFLPSPPIWQGFAFAMAEWNFRGRMASKVLDACTYTCKACPTVEELDEQRIGVEQATRKANECRLRLMTVAKIGSTYRENLSGEQHMVLKMLKMEWSSNSIPNDIEKVREEITEETARMNIAPADGCRSDLEQHDRLLTEQSKLNDQLQLTLREVEDSRKEMDELLQRWLDGLDELLAKINERYARFFQQVKCTGEVRLQKPEEKVLCFVISLIDLGVVF
ncbi:Structural maintenance of chromosomes protein 5 [Toxocara canis]|uniref:Structural maintenance of chromosomes protein 5 n=1 Tax=Toxocara canis TaxID=6265 RepID=A0A0B2VIN7_TOXCA|nr:Structural maintenance of chromosomes protein 5 [Toxocara canis]